MGQIAIFLLVTFAWSWGLWAAPVLVHMGIQIPDALQGIAEGAGSSAAWGPLVGAIVTAWLSGGVGALGQLLRRGVQFGFAARWYLAIFAIFPVILLVSWAIGSFGAGSSLPLPAFDAPFVLPIVFFSILFLGGPLQEEFGWRGTLLDPLQARFGALAASLITGAVWAVWHLPLFHFPNDTPYYDRPFWGLLVTTMLISVLFTWIYNNTGRSIAAMLLFHTMFNFSHYLFPTLGDDLAGLSLFAMQGGAAVIVVLMFGAKRLVREPKL